jgi:hypothetical protein
MLAKIDISVANLIIPGCQPIQRIFRVAEYSEINLNLLHPKNVVESVKFRFFLGCRTGFLLISEFIPNKFKFIFCRLPNLEIDCIKRHHQCYKYNLIKRYGTHIIISLMRFQYNWKLT